MQKNPHWHHLCQTREDYRELWDLGNGPGQKTEAKAKKTKKSVCMHRGKLRGRASCQCGPVYECGMYGGVCTPRKPPDNLTTLVIDGKPVEIIDLEIPFHACAGCEGFAVELHE